MSTPGGAGGGEVRPGVREEGQEGEEEGGRSTNIYSFYCDDRVLIPLISGCRKIISSAGDRRPASTFISLFRAIFFVARRKFNLLLIGTGEEEEEGGGRREEGREVEGEQNNRSYRGEK
ncbi:unnamed protein product [Danaus chrysippus]|uniref:(African queen) hypothetical protein n=1 Tax=Danaus chrysippus TaxID=151541 RepID=A0A8J2W463_9NEOP|nr:unnamed protein product [Danaus chrysippus]